MGKNCSKPKLKNVKAPPSCQRCDTALVRQTQQFQIAPRLQAAFEKIHDVVGWSRVRSMHFLSQGAKGRNVTSGDMSQEVNQTTDGLRIQMVCQWFRTAGTCLHGRCAPFRIHGCPAILGEPVPPCHGELSKSLKSSNLTIFAGWGLQCQTSIRSYAPPVQFFKQLCFPQRIWLSLQRWGSRFACIRRSNLFSNCSHLSTAVSPTIQLSHQLIDSPAIGSLLTVMAN